MPYKDLKVRKKLQKIYTQKWRERNMLLMEKLKSQPCVDCNQKLPHYVMQFDHVPGRGAKIKNIAMLVSNHLITSKVVQDELKKCDLVCANCHCIRTHQRKINVSHRQSA